MLFLNEYILVNRGEKQQQQQQITKQTNNSHGKKLFASGFLRDDQERNVGIALFFCLVRRVYCYDREKKQAEIDYMCEYALRREFDRKYCVLLQDNFVS